MLRENEDGEWMMPRGLSTHDMAMEIAEATFLFQESREFPNEPHGLTRLRNYVKVNHGDASPAKVPKVR